MFVREEGGGVEGGTAGDFFDAKGSLRARGPAGGHGDVYKYQRPSVRPSVRPYVRTYVRYSSEGNGCLSLAAALCLIYI